METNKAKLLPHPLNIPIFMASRMRFQQPQCRDKLKSYIGKKKTLYLSTDEDEDSRNNYAYRKYSNILGTNESKPWGPCKIPYKFVENSSSRDRNWQLAPNRYRLKSKPYDSKGGLSGAYWRKLRKTKPRKTIGAKPTFRLYDLPREMEKMDFMCHRNKGSFLSNARERAPSTRSMISNPLTARRDRNEPGPNTYTPREPNRTFEISQSPKPPQPHVFYRKSVVPLKQNSIHPQHISFRPGPGRYETRYRNICHCSRKLKYQPELDLLIEREKRLKFRRMPHTKIKSHLYCSPDWRHVQGAGFKRLFRGSKPQSSTVSAVDEAKSKSRPIKLFHDAKYFNMITNTSNNLGTFRQEPMPQLPVRITYNRMIKVISRKQLRTNRKIAFSSTAERWKDEDRPVPLTAHQLKELLERLPPERRVRDLPVMDKKKEEISSKLLETPPHMLPNYVPKLRKRLFKFLPLPPAKILVSDVDIRPVQPANHGYFLRPLDAKLFFKDDKGQN